jgi:hypothetical protein
MPHYAHEVRRIKRCVPLKEVGPIGSVDRSTSIRLQEGLLDAKRLWASPGAWRWAPRGSSLSWPRSALDHVVDQLADDRCTSSEGGHRSAADPCTNFLYVFRTALKRPLTPPTRGVVAGPWRAGGVGHANALRLACSGQRRPPDIGLLVDNPRGQRRDSGAATA